MTSSTAANIDVVDKMGKAMIPHAHGADAQTAVRNGFRHSTRVVTAASLIMVSVFAGFILPDDAIIKSIGFALTAGVLIDASSSGRRSFPPS